MVVDGSYCHLASCEYHLLQLIKIWCNIQVIIYMLSNITLYHRDESHHKVLPIFLDLHNPKCKMINLKVHLIKAKIKVNIKKRILC